MALEEEQVWTQREYGYSNICMKTDRLGKVKGLFAEIQVKKDTGGSRLGGPQRRRLGF